MNKKPLFEMLATLAERCATLQQIDPADVSLELAAEGIPGTVAELELAEDADGLDDFFDRLDEIREWVDATAWRILADVAAQGAFYGDTKP